MTSGVHLTRLATTTGLFVVALVMLGALIISKPTRNLQDFDQPFYVMLAYDLDRYGVFSNGPFSGVDDTVMAPPPGMFFGPVYPALVAAVMKFDSRFAAAARCSVAANRGHRNIATCDAYDLPARLLNALLLATAVVAIAAAAACDPKRNCAAAIWRDAQQPPRFDFVIG